MSGNKCRMGGNKCRMSVAEALASPAYALIRLRESPTVTALGGTRADLARLADARLESGAPPAGRRFDRLVAVPFRQVSERGFQAHDDGTPLSSITVEYEAEVPIGKMLSVLPNESIDVVDPGGFQIDAHANGRLVSRTSHT